MTSSRRPIDVAERQDAERLLSFSEVRRDEAGEGPPDLQSVCELETRDGMVGMHRASCSASRSLHDCER